jgi:hypothetical protein
MKGKGKLFRCILLVVLPFGCATTTQSPHSWVGVSQSELIAEWGDPDKIIANELEGNVLIYHGHQGLPSKSSDAPYHNGSDTKESESPGEAATQEPKYMFWLDNKGLIYHWIAEE